MKAFLFIVSLLCLLASNSIRAAEPLLFVTEEWAPYNFTRDGELTGFSTEIIQAMMAELGESHEIRVYPGARTTKVLDAQPNAVGFSYFRTPKRDNKYKWVGALVDEVIYLYKRKEDDRSFSSLEDARLVEGIVVSNKGIIQAKLEALGFDNYTKFTNNKDQIKHVLQMRYQPHKEKPSYSRRPGFFPVAAKMIISISTVLPSAAIGRMRSSTSIIPLFGPV